MRIFVTFVALLIAGCSHTSVQVSSGGTTTTTGGASVSVSGRGSNATWVLIGIGLIAAEHAGSQAARERGLEPEREPAQALDASRRVNEQDCSKPIQDWSANLKCR